VEVRAVAMGAVEGYGHGENLRERWYERPKDDLMLTSTYRVITPLILSTGFLILSKLTTTGGFVSM